MKPLAWPALVCGMLAAHALAGADESGQFWRTHWYERGMAHANPAFEKRFRVNSPEAVLHPSFGKRVEARENGLMLILAEEELSWLSVAELYLELWGGHPGSANKRVTINGRSTYYLPRVGTEEMHCTYHYPALPLKRQDLVNGYNAFQFAVDQGNTFWGHMLVDNACLRVALSNQHPDLLTAKLADFEARVLVQPTANPEVFELRLDRGGQNPERIVAVDFQGRYLGYDENGDRALRDWHGFTKNRRPVATLGLVEQPPFRLSWDTAMLPAQDNVSVRASVYFQGLSNLVYVTAPAPGFSLSKPSDRQVILFSSHDLPAPFWSRAGRQQQCTLYLDVPPSRIERAELHVNTWTGGAGQVQAYFQLNGRHFPVAEGSRHELVYNRLPVDPAVLVQGINRIELSSDTEHHGIEVLLPGPCLMIRSRR